MCGGVALKDPAVLAACQMHFTQGWRLQALLREWEQKHPTAFKYNAGKNSVAIEDYVYKKPRIYSKKRRTSENVT